MELNIIRKYRLFQINCNLNKVCDDFVNYEYSREDMMNSIVK